jgi:hypothetical protein
VGGGGGGGSVAGLYWAKPAVANSRDEEFDGDLSAWNQQNTLLGPVNPRANFSDVNSFRADCNVRPSWLRLQPSTAGQLYCYIKTIPPLPTSFVLIARAAIIFDGKGYGETGNYGNSSAVLRVDVCDSGGTDFAAIYPNISSGSGPQVMGRLNSGGSNFQQAIVPNSSCAMGTEQWSLFAIQRVGQVFIYWAGSDTGSWRHITTITASPGTAGNLDTIRILAGNQVKSTNIMCLDFIRFLETDQFPF